MVISDVADVVSNLEEDDEQTEANAELIANVFNQIDNLLEGPSNFTVSPIVSDQYRVVFAEMVY